MIGRERECQQRLREFATTMRIALEPGMPRAANGAVDPAGTCLYACLVLVSMIHRFRVGAAQIRGGDGSPGEGALTIDNCWVGHYWVETIAAGSSDPIVLDITSDQMGFDPVTVLPLADSVDRYRPGRQDLVDTAAAEIGAEVGLSALLWL